MGTILYHWQNDNEQKSTPSLDSIVWLEEIDTTLERVSQYIYIHIIYMYVYIYIVVYMYKWLYISQIQETQWIVEHVCSICFGVTIFKHLNNRSLVSCYMVPTSQWKCARFAIATRLHIEDGFPTLFVISFVCLWTMSGTEFSGDWPAPNSFADFTCLLMMFRCCNVFGSAFLHSTTLRMQLHKGCQIVWANMFT